MQPSREYELFADMAPSSPRLGLSPRQRAALGPNPFAQPRVLAEPWVKPAASPHGASGWSPGPSPLRQASPSTSQQAGPVGSCCSR